MSDPHYPPVSDPVIVDAVSDVNVNEENIVKILGRIELFGSGLHVFAGIVDENGTAYAIYPPSTEVELRSYQGHLIEFTVVKLDEPRGAGALFLRGGTVTPLGWEIVR